MGGVQLTLPGAHQAVVVGPDEFGLALEDQAVSVTRVDWRPPLAAAALRKIFGDEASAERMEAANAAALGRILQARCRAVDVRAASEVVPGLGRGMLLHAGPPLDWSAASGPMRGALIGAVELEGWAPDHERAERMLAQGEIELSPCHEHGAVGPMAGVISPSMPVFVVANEAFGNDAYANLNEGLGRVLRYGANDPAVLDHLRWLERVAGPLLGEALRRSEGVDLTSLMAQALQMGDELHNRNTAATALFSRQIAADLCAGRRRAGSDEDVFQLLRYLANTNVFFLNLAMGACKAALDPATGIDGSSVVTAMARNGTELGVWVSATGRRWFTAPSPKVEGLFFSGYGPDDANPDLGDSAITETAGLGGFALAAAPAIAQFVGGTAELGRKLTEEMYQITLAEHPQYQMPNLDFRGTPVGIDAVAVCRSHIRPVLDTGIAHREPGVGQIGAGIVRVPVEPFVEAVEALA